MIFNNILFKYFKKRIVKNLAVFLKPFNHIEQDLDTIHTVVFSHIHWNFYDVGNFRVYGPFPLESTCYQWWVVSNSLKYCMKKKNQLPSVFHISADYFSYFLEWQPCHSSKIVFCSPRVIFSTIPLFPAELVH